MKQINIYLNERFGDHFVKAPEKFHAEDFCLVDPVGDKYDEIYDDYADAMLINSSGLQNVFLILKSEARKYDGDPNVKIYELPSSYATFTLDEIEDAYEEGMLDPEELDEVDFRNY